MPKYIKKKALKAAIDCCTWYHINKNGELVEGANSSEHEPLYKYSDIKRIIKSLPTRKFNDEPQTCDDCIWTVCNYNNAFEDEPQTDCYVSDLCKHYGDKQICGRCRNRNLFCEAEPQPRCPKCGKRGYIRSLESMGVKLKVFDEYKWKCTNCNKYFKEEPTDESQTDCAWK